MGLEKLDPSWWEDAGVTPLMQAIRGRKPQEVERLLAGGADPNARSARGLTPLFLAAIEGDAKLAERLLAHGADPRAAAIGGAPPIVAAAFQGDVPFVELLLRKGAAPDASGKDGVTALMRAAQQGFATVVRVLLTAGADPHRRDPDGWTALTWAIYNDHVPVVDVLIDCGVPVDARDGQGLTDLMNAASWGRSATLERLLRASANPNAASPRGWTPLIMAAQRGYPDAVRRLLQGGAEPNARDASGRTALIYASARGHRPCVQLLLTHGADGSIEASDEKEPLRFVPLPPISRNPMPAKERRGWPWRLIPMVSTRRTLHGFDVRVSHSDEQETTVFKKVDDALDLLRQYRLPWFERMRRDLRRIVVMPYPEARASYIVSEHVCVLDFEYVCASGTPAVQVASSLLHEATHARLIRLGFGYREGERTRVERLCEKSELWFASRIPGAPDVVRAIQRELDGLRPSTFTDAALRQGRLDALKKLGVPDWAVRALGWWWERRAKRRRH